MPPAHSASSWAVRSAPMRAIRVSWPFSNRRARLGAEGEPLGRAPDAHRVEHGALDDDVAGRVRDLAVGAAHDAGDADRALRIGDEQRVVGQGAGHVVQRLELLPGGGAADDDRRAAVGAGVDRGGVERVDRLAQLEHHVVRGVDDVADRALARREEAHLDAVRRRPDRHAAHPAADEPRCTARAPGRPRQAARRSRGRSPPPPRARTSGPAGRSQPRPRAQARGSTARRRGSASRPRRGRRRRRGRRAGRPAACPRAGSGSRRRPR